MTGGAGLIGGMTVARLAATGADVTATRRGDGAGPPGVRWLTLDLREAETLRRAGPFELVLHAAAVLPTSHVDSETEAGLNRQIDESVFAAARAWQANVVYVSSTAVYGSSVSSDGISEDQPLDPPGPYATAKAASEQAGAAASAANGRPFAALRVSSPYAPTQRSMTVLRRFAERAVGGETLEYWGSGRRRQNFVHARDVARACESALRSEASGAFNVTADRAVSMRELAEIVAEAAGRPLSAVRAAGRPDPGEEAFIDYCNERARERLGWRPEITLEEGVHEWIEALRRNPAG